MASKRAKLSQETNEKTHTTAEDTTLSDNKEEFNLRPTQHPLLNPVVLDNLFQYCSTKYLGNYRQVCETWNSVATKTLRKRNVQIEFYTVKDFEQFCKAIKTTASPAIRHPFTNCKFHWETFKTVNNPTILECFNKCKDILEELYLPLDYEYQDVEDKLTVIPAITLPLMINLSSFTLDMQHAVPELLETYAEDNPTGTWSKKYLSPLFSSMPNLISFTLINRIAGQVHESLPHTRSVSEFVSHLLQLKQLTHLKLVALISDENLIAMNKLRLKALNLNIYNSQITSTVFNEFLSSQTQTLECLEIEEFVDFKRNLVIKFPRMEALKKLKVVVAHSEDNYFSISSYAKIFPNLRTFIYNRLNNECLGCWYDKSCTTLKEARIYFSNLPSPRIMYNMVQSFSALMKLEIFCGRYCQYIFQYMTTLEDLTLLGCHLSNEDLEFLLTGMKYTEDELALDTPFDQRLRPSIGLLTKLNNLSIVGQTTVSANGEEKKRLDVTDFTGYGVLLKMDSLKVLQIGPCKITEKCYRDMTKKFLVIPFRKDFVDGEAQINPRMNL